MEFLNLQQLSEIVDIEAIKQFLLPVLRILGGVVGLWIIFMIVSTALNIKRTKRVFLTYKNTEKIENKLEKIEEKIENLETKIDKIFEK